MPILEDAKEYVQRATGLRRPGRDEAPELARPRKPHTVSIGVGLGPPIGVQRVPL